MAISNYSELQTEIAAWVKRTDLTSKITDFITLAEAELKRELSLRQVEATQTGTTTSQTISLPSDFSQIERIELVANDRKYTLDYTSPNGIEHFTESTDVPDRYTIENGAIKLFAAPSSAFAYTLFYIPKIASLSAGSPTNWLLTNHPDAYLWGSCIQASRYAKDDAGINRFGPMYKASMESIKLQDERRRFPASGGLQIKPRGAR